MTMSTTGARWRPDRRGAVVALVVAGALVGLGRWIVSTSTAPAVAQQSLARPTTETGSTVAPPHDVASRGHYVAHDPPPVAGVAEAGGGTPDMKQVFDGYITSADPRERRIAASAFDACVPAFLPGRGESASPEPLIRALPPAHRAEREAAYRLLYARCATFLRESREWLIALKVELQVDPELQAPGQRARDQLIAGRYERVAPLVSQALSSDDPAAVASLAGLAERLAVLRNPERSDPDLIQRARAVDTALPWVACDLGLDCGANSMGALQLCAGQGRCDGDMLSRLLGQAVQDGVDDAQVRAQHARLLALVRSGRALGMADLLP